MLHKNYDRKGLVAKKEQVLAPRRTEWQQTASRKVTLTLTLVIWGLVAAMSQSPVGKDMSTNAEESTLLEAVTR
jgi:hypothetical protein